jgi:RNA polymerase sigma-70 factor (ECF subfamily)
MDERLPALFDAHADRLYRLARRLTSSADDALDLVQDTFLRAVRSPASIPRDSRGEEAWLVRILINIRRDQWRKDAVRKRHEPVVHPPDQPQDPEKTLLTRAAVWRALDALSPRRRAIVVMAEIDGLPVSGIAALLGISAITVRWHLSRGRRELTRRLSFELGDTDDQPQASLAGRRPAPSRSVAP